MTIFKVSGDSHLAPDHQRQTFFLVSVSVQGTLCVSVTDIELTEVHQEVSSGAQEAEGACYMAPQGMDELSRQKKNQRGSKPRREE